MILGKDRCTTQPGAFNVTYSGERGGVSMTDDHSTEFFCPGCGSRYKIVRVHADADLPHRLIHCKVCKQPLTPADGEYALKYFSLRKQINTMALTFV